MILCRKNNNRIVIFHIYNSKEGLSIENTNCAYRIDTEKNILSRQNEATYQPLRTNFSEKYTSLLHCAVITDLWKKGSALCFVYFLFSTRKICLFIHISHPSKDSKTYTVFPLIILLIEIYKLNYIQ